MEDLDEVLLFHRLLAWLFEPEETRLLEKQLQEILFQVAWESGQAGFS